VTTTGYVTVVLVLCTVFLGSLAGIGWLQRRVDTSPQVTPRSPADRERSRLKRDEVVSKAVLLAVEMARVDGFIAPAEMDAIRDFIVENVKRADDAFAARMMRKGVEEPAGNAGVDAAVHRVAEIDDSELTGLLLDLLVYVAEADGHVCAEERAFLRRVAEGVGLKASDVDSLITTGG
jgi:tellurite resistance protein